MGESKGVGPTSTSAGTLIWKCGEPSMDVQHTLKAHDTESKIK